MAFAGWDLPTQVFVGAFDDRLPTEDRRTALDSQLVLLLEDRKHEGRPAVRRGIGEQLRAAVRRTLSTS